MTLPWKLLDFGALFSFLSFCFLLIVYWVAKDGYEIEELRQLILEKKNK